MPKIRELIHSPHHLFVFEVCARLGSFTRAAAELDVSQPAVSLAIRQLEQAMGNKLFVRKHRSVSLTQVGEQFYSEVSVGLERILRSAAELKRRRKPAHVTLAVSTAFANYWMVPNLSSFHAER